MISIYQKLTVAGAVLSFAAIGTNAVQASQLVYSNDFEGTVGSEWSKTSTEMTPKGGRNFLGRFASEAVSLKLDNLTPHTDVSVSFDLFIIQSWDGNNTIYGSDIWELSVANGTTLLSTTFTNNPAFTQSYPNAFSSGDNPARSGADENNTLGYINYYGDSVYNLSFIFPHVDDSLELIFSGSKLNFAGLTQDSERWGLDNVKLSVTPAISIGSTKIVPIPEPDTILGLATCGVVGLLIRKKAGIS
ncbi:MAG TPA: hypothetical protein DEG17_00865 [Cyanobacteria bacterium UBA11149]|nr:hypothetical protein [Cyanobacteria bacterium UBA11367]HBE59108.1 hypothetical protein [Cyanobacteria bacterium UBA11366]HBK64106.1 hypothetical protein [Cyanobacteria bacterium UBA11166]HBR74820.1 hypothetical protein [Cyanobacteria bacterium UBA11159]HBS67966.1 hypothetical protein [Cyanobacteria bacterium UBA11153]HBW87464.1 hypothetical protein [Cyanobacteria bacterium UBA11149]HCA94073.1 hypothetical protein [Cyanobacteria bacterium UBA9226]